MGITPYELSLFETRPHRTKLWLSVYEPNTVLACQVNDVSISKGERSITYDGVTEGSHSLVESGMVMYIGTFVGDNDKGRIRVKSANASIIEIAENSHIEWSNNDYLTIVDFYEITAIYPRIIQDPADPTDVIFYKDYDIAYTNQNAVLGSFVNMGSHYAGFVDPATGEDDVYYSASGTNYVGVAGTSLNYHWWFQGGDPTGSHVHTPGFVTYDTPGHYTTRLIVSGSNNAVDSSYRHVSIYDKPGEGSDTPILNWEFDSLSGDRDSGGYRGRIRIREDIPEETIQDGSLVVIFAEDWYGDTKESIGGNKPNRGSIVFAGYILDGTITYNWNEKYVEFDIGSPTEIMKNIEGFSVSVESKNAPFTWFELKDMNVEKALYHYLRWHSTVLKACDFEFPDDDFRIQYFDSDRESLYSAINSLMEGTLIGNVVSDRQGKIWAEIDTSALDTPADYKEVSTLDLINTRWRGSPIIEERQNEIVSYLEMGGIAYSGPPVSTSQALMVEAPGNAPNYRGRVERHQGLALEDQNQLNTLAGNVFAHKNARYPRISYNLAGNFRNYDIAPQLLVPVIIEADDTPRRITFTDKNFTIEEMEFEYDAENESLFPTISVTEITDGDDAETVTIPTIPPTAGGETGGGYNVPPLQIPAIPSVVHRVHASAHYWALSDVPFDDPQYPEFDVDDGDWYGVSWYAVEHNPDTLDPYWEHNFSLQEDGAVADNYIVIPYTGKYLFEVTVYNRNAKDIEIGISDADLDDWTTVGLAQMVRLYAGNNEMFGVSRIFHYNKGDIVTMTLKNESGFDTVEGTMELTVALVDSYPT